MRRLLAPVVVVPVLVFAVSTGCSSVGPPSEEDRLRWLLAARGFAPEDVQLTDEDVIIEGDGVLSRSDLLAELGERDGDIETQTQPAYWFQPGGPGGARPSWLTVPAASELRLVFDAGVAQPVRLAVREAARRWSLAAGDCVSLSETNRGPVVRVKVEPLVGRDPRTGETFPVAGRARMPFWRDGAWQAGNVLWIDPSTADEGSGWLNHVALHELGHILGFQHPFSVLAGQHIPGTATASARGYPTVMDYQGEETALTADDLRGVQRMYRRDASGLCPGE